MASIIGSLIWRVALYSFGLFNYLLFLGLALGKGSFFRKTTEREKNEFLLARNKYWNLSETVFDFHHRFYVLRNGLQLHYLINTPNATPGTPQSKTIVIFLHGVPDNSMLWRYVTQSPVLQENAILIALDLPGFGGSDSFPHYGAIEVLEALTEFIVGMREHYISSDNEVDGQWKDYPNKVFIVGHDWGCALGCRLAAEAPCLADRFILTNAPHVPLAMANKDRIIASSLKMIRTFLHAPMANYHCLAKAAHAFRPLAFQILLIGYMAAFQLPTAMLRYLGVGGNYSFIRGAHLNQYGKDKTGYDPQHSLAMTMGPGEAECRTTVDDTTPQQYGKSVLARAKKSGAWFLSSAAYYRDGLAFDKWEKSIDTLGALYNIEIDNEDLVMKGNPLKKRRTSSASSALFSDTCANSLKAPATVVWGKKDLACTQPICLDGIGDYLTRDSQVVMLPNSGHWTPIERESRETLKAILERVVQSGDLTKSDLQEIVKATYPGAFVSIDK